MSQSYQLEGKVLLVMDAQTFESGFTKRELIVEVKDGKYPQEVSVEWVQDSVALLDGIEVGDNDLLGTFIGKSAGHGSADAAGATGNDDNLVFEFH